MSEFKSFFKVVGGNEGTLCRYNARLEAVRRLQDAGIDVAVRLSPYVPDHWEFWRENVNPNREDCCNLGTCG